MVFLPAAESYSSCHCPEVKETFLPNAKRGNGITAYVEVIEKRVYDQELNPNNFPIDPFPINYYQVKVLKNLRANAIADTINILIPGEVDCCITYPNIGNQGDRAILHAFEWDESDYGYLSNEFHGYYLSACMIPYIKVENDFAIGPITSKNKQRIPIEKVLRKF